MFAAVWVCCGCSVPLPFLLTFEMAAFRDLTSVRCDLRAVSGAKADFRAHRVDFTNRLLKEQKKIVLGTKGTTYGRIDTGLRQRATVPEHRNARQINDAFQLYLLALFSSTRIVEISILHNIKIMENKYSCCNSSWRL